MTLNRIFYLSVLSAVAMGIYSLYSWFQLPADAVIATHWNASGEADGFSSKTFGLALIPLITLAIGGLLKALPYLEPRKKHLQKSPKLIAATFFSVVLVMWVADLMVVGTALGWAIDFFFLMKIAIGLMLVLIGNYAAKSQSMFLVGLRTPWTLSSETVWIKTHRLFGRMFVISGLILIFLPMGWFAKDTFSIIFMALILGPVLVSLVYSWVIWRQEQQDLND